ncbi:DNA translocase FtsK 4TM domain-containing protein [Xanthobacter autotrophicus]|nr:DNA translocase FtsK [Xanthobacter autotrophicus]MDI4666699.1 DNA translocase FtsK 4TM domain-containing protein [Xanthobacter autotrophicus]
MPPVAPRFDLIPESVRLAVRRRGREIVGTSLIIATLTAFLALGTWSASDPSLSNATHAPVTNLLGWPGAVVADLLVQLFGLAALAVLLPPLYYGWRLVTHRPFSRERMRTTCWLIGVLGATAFLGALPRPDSWPGLTGIGGALGDLFPRALGVVRGSAASIVDALVIGAAGLAIGTTGLFLAVSGGRRTPLKVAPENELPGEMGDEDEEDDGAAISLGALTHTLLSWKARLGGGRLLGEPRGAGTPGPAGAPAPRRGGDRVEPRLGGAAGEERAAEAGPDLAAGEPRGRSARREPNGRRGPRRGYQHPSLDLLTPPVATKVPAMSPEALADTAKELKGTLEDFGVRGEIGQVRPGPVVTLYELEPAPGIKSSRVIGLADDIARSMSAVSARVAVVPGRNAIGIELPNQKREKVLLRELLATKDFGDSGHKLAIALGKTIGGDPVIVDLARMPHLLVAGTTGSGKSVAINTMILSLLYRLKPEQCRLIMVDPKMLELSVYDGIPHLLAPVVTDPKKAVVALKWAVKEMEDRYKKMSKLGVRNIDGFNARVKDSTDKGETLARTVQTGFDHETGEAIYEREEMNLEPLPYIVVIVDEMADLMLVAGKDIEGAIQRLAQMARAAGIHLVMATQRPSVDVITGTIKANFPTRISFQVTSKIDSRTILGEMGAEQLLGQGDMLYMAGGGRISRVHGPFVADEEVESVVKHLKSQGVPSYVEAVTAETDDEDEGTAVFDKGAFGEEGQDLYSQAVAVVMRDRKCSTSYIQRRLQIGYNRAASLVERMEKEGLVAAPNHAGKREILMPEEAAE